MPDQLKPQKDSMQLDSKIGNSMINKIIDFYQKHILILWLLIIILPIIILSVGYLLLPELFYDQFIWPYFWGTIEADAQDRSYGEVTEAYNPVNTIIYAFIVIIVLYWVYKLFKKFKIEIDLNFFLAIIPFILIGGISRGLEDAELFHVPIVYLFIAPIIYIFIGVVVIGLILIGVGILRYTKRTSLHHGFVLIGGVLVALDIIYIIFYIWFKSQFSYILNPIIPVITSIVILIGLKITIDKTQTINIPTILLSVGLWCLVINLIILSQWQSIPEWTNAYSSVHPDKTIELQPLAFLLVISIVILCVAFVYIIARLLLSKYPNLKPFMLGINLLLFFGHFLDATATFIAIDYYGYVEKHVLPSFLINVFQTGAVMLLLKAIIVIIVIYFIDILYEKEFQNNPTLTGLVKIAVLVLGLAPGVRDLLRMTIGV